MIVNERKLLWGGAILLVAALAVAGIDHLLDRRTIPRRPHHLIRVAFQQPPAAHTPNGAALYKENCSSCHQTNRKGSAPNFPSLIGVEKRWTDEQLASFITDGTSVMPSSPDLKSDEVAALIHYLKTAGAPTKPGETSPASPASTQPPAANPKS